MVEFLLNYQFGLYLCLFLLPFAQEDAAILFAASASVSGLGHPLAGFIWVLLGLCGNISIKYVIGRAAINHKWARKLAENPKVEKAGEQVRSNLGKSLFLARFFPPVRLPCYIATGFFNLEFPKVLFFSVTSALLYLAIAFTLFHLLGEAIGSQLRIYLPLIAVAMLVAYFLFRVFRVQKMHGNK